MKFPIGKTIAEKLEENGKTAVWLSEKISTSSRNARYLLLRESVDTNTLLLVSKALKFDFFKLYSEELDKELMVKEAEIKYTKVKKIGELRPVHITVKYPVESSELLGKFMMHVHAIADQMGFIID